MIVLCRHRSSSVCHRRSERNNCVVKLLLLEWKSGSLQALPQKYSRQRNHASPKESYTISHASVVTHHEEQIVGSYIKLKILYHSLLPGFTWVLSLVVLFHDGKELLTLARPDSK